MIFLPRALPCLSRALPSKRLTYVDVAPFPSKLESSVSCAHNTVRMEVASPLPFTPGQAGTKRSFPCSPGLVENTTAAVGMDIGDDYAHQSFKRRRFNDHADTTLQTTPHAANPFATMATKSPSSFFNGAFLTAWSWDRCAKTFLLMS